MKRSSIWFPILVSLFFYFQNSTLPGMNIDSEQCQEVIATLHDSPDLSYSQEFLVEKTKNLPLLFSSPDQRVFTGNLLNWASQYFSADIKTITFQAPMISYGVDQVYLVFVQKKLVGALKVFFQSKTNFLNELVGSTILGRANLKEFSNPPVLTYGKIDIRGQSFPAILSGPAQGKSVENWLTQYASLTSKDRIKNLVPLMSNIGHSLAAFHLNFKSNRSKADLKQASALLDYELETMDHALERGGLIHDYSNKGMLDPKDYLFLKRAIAQVIDRVRVNPPALLTITHSDFHVGDVFVSEPSSQVQVVDMEGLIYSVSSSAKKMNRGILDANIDIGRFYESLAVTGSDRGFSDEEISALQSAFLSAYSEKSGISLEDLGKTLLFYRLRFAAAVLADLPGYESSRTFKRRIMQRMVTYLKAELSRGK